MEQVNCKYCFELRHPHSGCRLFCPNCKSKSNVEIFRDRTPTQAEIYICKACKTFCQRKLKSKINTFVSVIVDLTELEKSRYEIQTSITMNSDRRLRKEGENFITGLGWI